MISILLAFARAMRAKGLVLQPRHGVSQRSNTWLKFKLERRVGERTAVAFPVVTVSNVVNFAGTPADLASIQSALANQAIDRLIAGKLA